MDFDRVLPKMPQTVFVDRLGEYLSTSEDARDHQPDDPEASNIVAVYTLTGFVEVSKTVYITPIEQEVTGGA